MKTLKKIGILHFILFASISLTAFVWNEPADTKKQAVINESKNFVVLELFTSEGCNSCPPAEEVFARLAKDYKGKSVYLLNYHVDYFDRLGWKDAFGSAENSARQKQYGQWLPSQVYTPQLVVNGSSEFIGSDEKPIRNAITRAQDAQQITTLQLEATISQDVVRVNYKTTDIQAGDELQLALIQKNGSTNVLRGENEGLKFDHSQIVINMVKVSIKGKADGTAALTIPKSALGKELEVIGLVQNNRNGKIHAANSAALVK